MTPHYWTEAKIHLARRCPTMATLIARYEGEGLTARGDGFYTLIRAITGQQISVKAADSIWAKVTKAVHPLTPENLLRKRDATLRACGLSASKVAYMRNVAEFWIERGIPVLSSPLEGEPERRSRSGGGTPASTCGTYPPRSLRSPFPLKAGANFWHNYADADIIRELTSIKGIGAWTAEMFLIFHLMRPDVLPLKDLGLLKAIDLHYTNGKRLKPAEYTKISAAWAPYRTVATWYLWRALDPVPVEY